MPDITVQTSRILLVEDDHDDAALAQRAFRKANVWNPLDVARSGQEAWEYLTHQGAFADAAKYPPPLFVLVDLNLPGMDGRELISRIQSDIKNGNSFYYFTVSGLSNIFIGSSQISNEMPVSMAGDSIRISFDNDTSGLIDISAFSNLSLKSKQH